MRPVGGVTPAKEAKYFRLQTLECQEIYLTMIYMSLMEG